MNLTPCYVCTVKHSDCFQQMKPVCFRTLLLAIDCCECVDGLYIHTANRIKVNKAVKRARKNSQIGSYTLWWQVYYTYSIRLLFIHCTYIVHTIWSYIQCTYNIRHIALQLYNDIFIVDTRNQTSYSSYLLLVCNHVCHQNNNGSTNLVL